MVQLTQESVNQSVVQMQFMG